MYISQQQRYLRSTITALSIICSLLVIFTAALSLLPLFLLVNLLLVLLSVGFVVRYLRYYKRMKDIWLAPVNDIRSFTSLSFASFVCLILTYFPYSFTGLIHLTVILELFHLVTLVPMFILYNDFKKTDCKLDKHSLNLVKANVVFVGLINLIYGVLCSFLIRNIFTIIYLYFPLSISTAWVLIFCFTVLNREYENVYKNKESKSLILFILGIILVAIGNVICFKFEESLVPHILIAIFSLLQFVGIICLCISFVFGIPKGKEKLYKILDICTLGVVITTNAAVNTALKGDYVNLIVMDNLFMNIGVLFAVAVFLCLKDRKSNNLPYFCLILLFYFANCYSGFAIVLAWLIMAITSIVFIVRILISRKKAKSLNRQVSTNV